MVAFAHQLARQHGADGAVDVARPSMNCTFSPRSRAGLASSMSWWSAPCPGRGPAFSCGDAASARHRVEDAAEVRPSGLPVRSMPFCVEQVGAADQVVELADAQLRHDLARTSSATKKK